MSNFSTLPPRFRMYRSVPSYTKDTAFVRSGLLVSKYSLGGGLKPATPYWISPDLTRTRYRADRRPGSELSICDVMQVLAPGVSDVADCVPCRSRTSDVVVVQYQRGLPVGGDLPRHADRESVVGLTVGDHLRGLEVEFGVTENTLLRPASRTYTMPGETAIWVGFAPRELAEIGQHDRVGHVRDVMQCVRGRARARSSAELRSAVVSPCCACQRQVGAAPLPATHPARPVSWPPCLADSVRTRRGTGSWRRPGAGGSHIDTRRWRATRGTDDTDAPDRGRRCGAGDRASQVEIDPWSHDRGTGERIARPGRRGAAEAAGPLVRGLDIAAGGIDARRLGAGVRKCLHGRHHIRHVRTPSEPELTSSSSAEFAGSGSAGSAAVPRADGSASA